MTDKMDVQIGPNSGSPIKDGIGCVLQAIALAIVIFAIYFSSGGRF